MGARGTQPEWKPVRESGQPAQYTINQAVRDLHGGKQTWRTYPTPTTSDRYNTDPVHDKNRGFLRMEAHPSESKSMTASEVNKKNGQLNPDWVEWLMGWPIGWTKTEPIELDWRDWSIDPADNNEIPRVSQPIENRVSRLKAIGNGQVPLVAATAWKILSECLQ
jgi:DNA (cytosine-5)-methyltransferase 1